MRAKRPQVHQPIFIKLKNQKASKEIAATLQYQERENKWEYVVEIQATFKYHIRHNIEENAIEHLNKMKRMGLKCQILKRNKSEKNNGKLQKA